jgi:hypothetical protein
MKAELRCVFDKGSGYLGLAGRAAIHPKYAGETLPANVEKLYLELLACTATVVEECD